MHTVDLYDTYLKLDPTDPEITDTLRRKHSLEKPVVIKGIYDQYIRYEWGNTSWVSWRNGYGAKKKSKPTETAQAARHQGTYRYRDGQ